MVKVNGQKSTLILYVIPPFSTFDSSIKQSLPDKMEVEFSFTVKNVILFVNNYLTSRKQLTLVQRKKETNALRDTTHPLNEEETSPVNYSASSLT